MTSVHHLPEVLMAVAQYQPRQAHGPRHADGTGTASAARTRIHDRPSLAWSAAHPVARLTTEMRAAERVVFFDTTGRGGPAKEASARVLSSTSALPAEARRVVFAKEKDTAPRWRRWLRRLDFAEVNVLDDADAEDADGTTRLDGTTGSTSTTATTATTTTSSTVTAAVQRRRDCGVEMGGLVSVLVSREYLLSRGSSTVRAAPTRAAAESASYVSHQMSSLPSLRAWLATHTDPPELAHYLPTGTEADFFLFAPATVTQAWLSLPEAATFARGAGGRRGGGVDTGPSSSLDSQRHRSKSAAATYVAARFAESDRTAADSAFVYRRLFLSDTHAVSRLLLDASRWWFQRPIAWHELPRACARTQGDAAQATVVPPIQLKLVDDLFSTPLWTQLGTRWLRHIYAVHDGLRGGGPPRPLPPCAITRYVARCWSSGRHVSSDDALSSAHAAPPSFMANLVMMGYAILALWYGLFVVVRQFLATRRVHDEGTASSVHAAAAAVADPLRAAVHAALDRTDSAQRGALWRKLGVTYAAQLQALDVSYTSVSGSDLLAVMDGTTSAATQLPGPSALRTLDLCGCRCLHHGAQAHARLPTTTETGVEETAEAGAPFTDPLTRALQWLPPHSALGRALAIATCAGGLQLVSASGSSLDDRALRELGHVCLLLEATQRASPATADGLASACSGTRAVVRPSLLAMDMTSCDAVTNLNPLSFVGSLLQLLVAFSAVHSASITYLDGSHYATVLAELLAPFTEADRHARAAHQLLCGSAPDVSRTSASTAVVNDPVRRAARHGLYRTFCSHFYHLDFAYCIPLEDINSLGRQRALQYVNTSHCRLTDDGVKQLSGPGAGRGGTTTPDGPPLRVVIAEFCDLLGTLEGFAWLSQLKKLYVRSSSLTDAGLAALAAHASPLELLELSYCPKVENLACLARLPQLRTLILDCTEVKRDGVKGLAACPALQTLSLRCCADFASVGASKDVFDTHVVKIPTLTHYVYEDLIGDEAYREYE